MNYYLVFTNISVFISIGPFLLGMLLYKKLDENFKWIFYYSCFAFATEMSGKIAKLLFQNNRPVYTTFILVELYFICYIFYKMIPFRWAKNSIKLFLILFPFYWFYCAFFVELNNKPNFYARIVECFIIVPFGAAGMLYYSSKTNNPVHKIPEFVFSSAVLFFYSTAIVIYSINLILTPDEILEYGKRIWSVHSLVNIVFNIFVMLALWYNSRRIKFSY